MNVVQKLGNTLEKKKINFQILGTGVHSGSECVTSHDLETRLGYAPGTIKKSSDVERRFFIVDETASDLGAEAAKKALIAADIEMSQLDAIVSVGAVPQQAIPSTAALIHRKLGLKKVVAFDLNASCIGFLHSLFSVGNLISQGFYKHVLIVASEIASVGLNPDDPHTASLFGDGAAAVVLGPSSHAGILSCHFETNSEKGESCTCELGGTLQQVHLKTSSEKKYFQMNGPQLVKYSLPPLFKMIKKLKSETEKEIDLFIPHQASPLALDLVRKKMGVEENQFVHIVRQYGNMIAASLPFALHHAITEKKLQRNDLVMLFGTAAGLSIGGVVLEY